MSHKGALVNNGEAASFKTSVETICGRVSNARPVWWISAHGNLEVLLLLEKHGETDDGSIDQKTADNGHDHGGNLDSAAVRKDGWEG